MSGGFEKKKVYVVTAWLKEQDEEGTSLNWSSSEVEYFAATLEEAEKLKELSSFQIVNKGLSL